MLDRHHQEHGVNQVIENISVPGIQNQDMNLVNAVIRHPLAGMIVLMLPEPVVWQSATSRDTLFEQIQKNIRISQVNPAFCEQLHSHEDALTGADLAFLARYNLSWDKETWFGLLDSGSLRQSRQIRRADGKTLWILGDYLLLQDKAGRLLGLIGVHLNMTTIYNAEEKIRHNRDTYQLLAEFSSDVIWRYNLVRRCFTYISPSVQYLIGYSADEALHLDAEQLIGPRQYAVMEEQISQWLEVFRLLGRQPDHDYVELQLQHQSGDLIWSEISGRFYLNEQDELELIGNARNIESRKRNEERITYLSYHDQLTTLYNRHFYTAELRRLDVERNLPMSVIFSDVNGLKATNDIFGHLAGDRLLVAYADILQAACRADDIIARVGGDEFVILLPATEEEQAERILERIRDMTRNARLSQSVLSVSFGLVSKTSPEQSFSDLLKTAEDRMYNQKLVDRVQFERQLLAHIIMVLYRNDPEERMHSHRVGRLAKMLAQDLGLSGQEIRKTILASRLHDVGMIGVDQKVRAKKEPLTDDDWLEIRKHVDIGYKILKNIKHYDDIAEAVLAHHEWLDGTGYPRGLQAEKIPLISRIISIADAYDAMNEKKKFSCEDALDELVRCSDSQFDGSLVKRFVSLIRSRTA